MVFTRVMCSKVVQHGIEFYNHDEPTDYTYESEECDLCTEGHCGQDDITYPPQCDQSVCYLAPICHECHRYDRDARTITYYYLRTDHVIYVQDSDEELEIQRGLKGLYPTEDNNYGNSQQQWALCEAVDESILDRFKYTQRNYNEVGIDSYITEGADENASFDDIIALCTCTNCGKKYTAVNYMTS